MIGNNYRIRALSLICLLLTLSFLSGTLVGCGIIINREAGTDHTVPDSADVSPIPPYDDATSAAPDKFTEPDLEVDLNGRLDGLIDWDFEGGTLLFIYADELLGTFFSETEQIIYDNIKLRDQSINEHYNMSVAYIVETAKNIERDLSKAVASGEYYADAMMLPLDSTYRLYAAGDLKNLRALSLYDPAEPGTSDASGSLGGKVYFDTGAATRDYLGMYSLYFNRIAAGDAATRTLFSSALDGKLTWDTVLAVEKEHRGELSSFSIDAPDYTFAADIVAASYGITYIENSKAPKLSYADKYFDSVSATLAQMSHHFFRPAEGESANEKFAEGSSLFHLAPLKNITDMATTAAEWGILPIPKADVSAPYTSMSTQNRAVISIPKNTTRTDIVGCYINALNATSGVWIYHDLLPTLKLTVMRDNDSYISIFNIILSEEYFDTAYILAPAVSGLDAATYGIPRRVLAECKPPEIPELSKLNTSLTKLFG